MKQSTNQRSAATAPYIAFVSLLIVGLVISVGCGPRGGEGRYRVSGKVTHGGQPVPAGQIIFEPDAEKGNSGPQGFAEIHNGLYDTNLFEGKGTVGGPHRVLVSGFDRFSKDETDTVKQLFPEYSTALDLPKGESTQDIDVPAQAAATE